MTTPQDPLDIRLRRLKYRSWHRGCKETDVILGTFCDRHVEGLDAPALDTYEAFLQEDDADIWAWLTHKEPAPRDDYAPLLEKMRALHE